MNPDSRIRKRPFTMSFSDPTAIGGAAKVTFDPSFDRLPSTRQPVNTPALGRRYFEEVLKPARP